MATKSAAPAQPCPSAPQSEQSPASSPQRASLVPLASLKIHSLAVRFPPLSKRQFAELLADVKRNGVRTPITRYRDGVLDGWHRVQAAREAGLAEVPAVEYDGVDPVGHVVAANLLRRHLTKSQRAVLGVTIKRQYQREAEKRKQGPQGGNFATLTNSEGKSRDRAGADVGVSGKYIQDAEKIEQTHPKIFKDLAEGTLSFAGAKRKIRAADSKKRDTPTPAVLEDRERARRAVEGKVADIDGAVWSAPGKERFERSSSRLRMSVRCVRRVGKSMIVVEVREVTAGGGRKARDRATASVLFSPAEFDAMYAALAEQGGRP